MLFETSWDDFAKTDLKLIQLLDKYSIPATFYVPIQSGLGIDHLRSVAERYTIGSHTISHPADLKLVEEPFLTNEIVNSKKMLEMVIDQKITSFCYPRGRFNDYVISVVEQAGYTEARTVEVLRTDVGYDPFRKPTTIHCYARKEYEGRDWLDLAKEYFEKAKTEDSYFHIWGHSKELEKYKEWDKLEEFFEFCHKEI